VERGYTYTPAPCTAADDGAQVSASGGGCWIADLPECLNILTFGGGRRDGMTSNSAVLIKMLNTTHAKCIYLPAGRFSFAAQVVGTLTGNNSLTIKGDGSGSTELFWPNAAGGLRLEVPGLQNAVRVADLSFLTGRPDGGDGLYITTTMSTIPFPYSVQSTISRVTFRGSDGLSAANYWTRGLRTFGVSYVSCESCFVWGGNPGADAYGALGIGWDIEGDAARLAVVFNIWNSGFWHTAAGVTYGGYVQGVTVQQSNFVGGRYGIHVPAGTAGQGQLGVATSHFNVSGAGIFEEAEMLPTTISGSYFIIPSGVNPVGGASVGIDMPRTVMASVADNSFAAAAVVGQGVGLKLGQGTLPGPVGTTVTGNILANLATGIELGATMTTAKLTGNSYSVNTVNVSNLAYPANVVDVAQDCSGTVKLQFADSSTGLAQSANCSFSSDGVWADVAGAVTLTAKGTGTGLAQLSGLPVAAGAKPGSCAFPNTTNFAAVPAAIGGYIPPGTALALLTVQQATATSGLTPANFTDTSAFWFTCRYSVQ
jgi:hypothetical protein